VSRALDAQEEAARRADALGALVALFPPRTGGDRDLEAVVRLFVRVTARVPLVYLEAACGRLAARWRYPSVRPADVLEEARAVRAEVRAARRASRAAAERRQLEGQAATPAEIRALADDLERRATQPGHHGTHVWAVLAGFLRSAATAREQGIGGPALPVLAAGTPSTCSGDEPGGISTAPQVEKIERGPS
jgi:hypothetical protein